MPNKIPKNIPVMPGTNERAIKIPPPKKRPNDVKSPRKNIIISLGPLLKILGLAIIDYLLNFVLAIKT